MSLKKENSVPLNSARFLKTHDHTKINKLEI